MKNQHTRLCSCLAEQIRHSASTRREEEEQHVCCTCIKTRTRIITCNSAAWEEASRYFILSKYHQVSNTSTPKTKRKTSDNKGRVVITEEVCADYTMLVAAKTIVSGNRRQLQSGTCLPAVFPLFVLAGIVCSSAAGERGLGSVSDMDVVK